MGRYIPDSRQSERVAELGPNDDRLLPFAQDVAIQRGVAVAESLFDMAAIRSLQGVGAASREARIECVLASAQDCRARHGQQAAHLLPGRITVGGRSVWEHARVTPPAHVTRRELELLEDRTEAGFARTTVLPAIFNRADSQAERMAGAGGLKPLFADVVRWMWQHARVDAARPLHVDTLTSLHALGLWFRQVNRVYELAAGRKAQASQVGGGSGHERALEARILAIYAESFKVGQPARFLNGNAAFLRTRYAAL